MTVAFSIRFALLLGSTTVCLAAACAGNVVDPGSDGAKPMTAADCAESASEMACETCVRVVDLAGGEASDVLTIRDCGCAAGSMCNSACKDDPTCPAGMTTPVIPGCDVCLRGITNGEPCVAVYMADCEANSDCTQFLHDFQPCAGLP
jgi:hypothetical protein